MKTHSSVIEIGIILFLLAFGLIRGEEESKIGSNLILSADTSRPEMNTFALGEKVLLNFSIHGATPSDAGQKLLLDFQDEHGQSLGQKEVAVQTDSDGSWKETVEAPHQRLGFYRVKVKLAHGVELPKLGSRAAGYLTYCIVPDPSQRTFYPSKETRFGMQGGFCPKVNVLPFLGIRWMLGGFKWGDLEPNHAGEMATARAAAKQEGRGYPVGNWDWPFLFANGQTNTWKVYELPSLYLGPPTWATLEATRAYVTAALTPEGEKAWRDYCLEVGRAYLDTHPDMDEHVYQITWEPVYPWGFKGTDEQLIRIYEIAYPALHETDPKAVVIGPTCGSGDVTWHARLFAKGIGKYLDGVSIHPYKAMPPERTGLIEDVRLLKEIVRQATGKDLPWFGTEQGWATNEDPNLELDQARGLIRANLILLGEDFRMNMAFYSADFPAEPGYGYYYNLNSKIAFGTDKISPKPIAPAYAAQSFLLEGSSAAGPIEWLGPTALGYAFERKDAVILALWDYGDQPHEASLPVGVKTVEVYDWMGNSRMVSTNGDVLKLTLTPEPVYVKGVSATLWGRTAKRPLTLTASRLTSYPGGQVVLTGQVTAALGGLEQGLMVIEPDSRLGISCDEQKISLQRGQLQSFRTPISVLADVPLGFYPIKATLQNEGRAIAGSGWMLHIASPIRMEAQPGYANDGNPMLTITFSNLQSEKLDGSVQVNLRGILDSTQKIPFKLKPHQSQDLTVEFKDGDLQSARVYMAKLAVKLTSGGSFEQELPVNFWKAPRFSKPPAIDGDLARWNGVTAIELKGREWVVRSPELYTGAEDLSAILRYGWDEHALYFTCEVQDDIFYQPYTGFFTWKADSIQLAFDLDHGKVEEKTGNMLADAGSQRRYSEIDLALTKEGPQAFRAITFDAAHFPCDLIPAGKLPLTIVRKDHQIIYEAAIPWTELGATKPPKEGEIIGIAATVNDADNAEQLDPKALGIFGGIHPVKDPGKFGSLILGGKL